MPIARSKLIDSATTPFYHCMSRCVRRSFICGDDDYTGKNYDHRKSWLVDRMKFLADVFSINICAFAVLSNHYHLVLHIDEASPDGWSAEDIEQRWAKLYPLNAKQFEQTKKGLPPEAIEQQLLSWKERLTSISWFMRCLNEPIARMANEEDECKGHFWEGRFKSQSLLDDAALLTAMAYVDLNPIRAGIAKTPETSEFTSIYERIKLAKQQLDSNIHRAEPKSYTDFDELCDSSSLKQPRSLMPFSIKDKKHSTNDLSSTEPKIEFTLSDYLFLVDTTGRIFRDNQKGSIPAEALPILDRLNLTQDGWLNLVKGLETDFCYAVGNESALNLFNTEKRQRKLKGSNAASKYYSDIAA